MVHPASWIEVSRSALEANLNTLRALGDSSVRVAPVIKANAYGHGLRLCAEVLTRAGADFLCVNELSEAEQIMDLAADVYVLGPTQVTEAQQIATLGVHVVVSSVAHVEALAEAGRAAGRVLPVHIKVETGTHRQGMDVDEALALIQIIDGLSGVRLAGVTTHLADVEDETEHSYATTQLERFERACQNLADGVLKHCAASAAHIVLPRARFDMVRLGIAVYGLWPSSETRISADIVHEHSPELIPALSWKTRVVQLSHAAVGSYVGYGRTKRLDRDSTLALLPIGYYDGYDRALSGKAKVLVGGLRCPVVGRVCMNMMMVDVTDVASVSSGDEVVLIGKQGEAQVTADDLAAWAETINYEVVTRIQARIPRIEVE